MYNKQRTINDIERIDIKEYIRTFILTIQRNEGRSINANHLGGSMHMKDLLDRPEYTRFKSFKSLDGFHYWNEQKVKYVPSNLGRGRGYIFYFICNGCRRNVKHLYQESLCETPVCRICSRIGYQAPKRKARELSRLLRKDYHSTEEKYYFAKKMGIGKEDIDEKKIDM